MAYDETLAERVREVISLRPDVSERQMFGGIGWMIAGNMAVGIIGDGLLVRVAPEDRERALAEPHARVMDFTGRPMKGFVIVDPPAIGSDGDLAGWVDSGADYASSLPPK